MKNTVADVFVYPLYFRNFCDMMYVHTLLYTCEHILTIECITFLQNVMLQE